MGLLVSDDLRHQFPIRIRGDVGVVEQMLLTIYLYTKHNHKI